MFKKRLLSGVKPTSQTHLGNYFGAMKQFVDLQENYESLIMIADYHALNLIQDPIKMKENIFNIALDYLAIGLDPEKVIIFKQSDISEHTELAWIFETITSVPYLMRAHAYKDAENKEKEINAGTFNYPMLMAADILLYDVDVVPVGLDQKQHIEYARDTALKFNKIYGQTFKLPKESIVQSVSVVPGIDGQKMSKSYGNTIPLFGNDDEIKKAVMKIVTDSKKANEKKDFENCNIFALHKLFLKDQELTELKNRYLKGDISYQESKEKLLKEIIHFLEPMKQKRKLYEENPEKITQILKEGALKAKTLATEKMKIIKQKIGV
jgi:tryptophanyl-tRNA synthetase